jgi:hypothetical protein
LMALEQASPKKRSKENRKTGKQRKGSTSCGQGLVSKVAVVGLLGICSLLGQHFLYTGAAEHGGHGNGALLVATTASSSAIREIVREEMAAAVGGVKAELKQMQEQIRTEAQKLKNSRAADSSRQLAQQPAVQARAVMVPQTSKAQVVQAKAAPVQAAPVQAAPAVQAAPIVQAAPVVQAAPIVQAAPVVQAAKAPSAVVVELAAKPSSVPLDISETDPKSSSAGDVLSWCKEVHEKHGVDLAQTWGSLSKQGQARLRRHCGHVHNELGGSQKGKIEGYTVDEYT